MSNPYAAPDADIRAPGEEGEYQPKMFSFNGRIGRARYFGWGFLLNLIGYIPLAIALAVIAPNMEADSNTALIITIPFFLLVLAISFVLTRRRLHDLNRSSWWFLLFVVPLLNIFFSLYLLFWPGTPVSNRFGLPPTKNGAIIWLVIGLGVVAAIGVLAAVALPAYQEYLKAAAEAAANSAS